MYPLVMPPNARHRREPSVQQRIRTSLGLLGALALVAALGVFGPSLAGGQSFQASIIAAAPVSPRLFGWATCALPLAGLFGVLAPTRWAIPRVVLSLVLLVPSAVLMAVMSKPRGIHGSQWAVNAEFARAQEVTTYALLAALFLWAIVSAAVIGTRRLDDVVIRLRRSVLWAGPLTIAASLAVAFLIS